MNFAQRLAMYLLAILLAGIVLFLMQFEAAHMLKRGVLLVLMPMFFLKATIKVTLVAIVIELILMIKRVFAQNGSQSVEG